MNRTPLNLRIRGEPERATDERRIKLCGSLGTIPTRSDVLRLALATSLEMLLDASDADRLATAGAGSRKAC